MNVYIDKLMRKFGFEWPEKSRKAFGIGVSLIPVLLIMWWFLPALSWYTPTIEKIVLLSGVVIISVLLYSGRPKKIVTLPTNARANAESWMNQAAAKAGVTSSITPVMPPAWLLIVVLGFSGIFLTWAIVSQIVIPALIASVWLGIGVIVFLSVLLLAIAVSAQVPYIGAFGRLAWKHAPVALLAVAVVVFLGATAFAGGNKDVVEDVTPLAVVNVSDEEQPVYIESTFSVTNALYAGITGDVVFELNSAVSMVQQAFNGMLSAQSELMASPEANFINWATIVGTDPVVDSTGAIPDLVTLSWAMEQWLEETHYESVDGVLVQVDDGFSDRVMTLYTEGVIKPEEAILYNDLAKLIVGAADALQEAGELLVGDDPNWSLVERKLLDYNEIVIEFKTLLVNSTAVVSTLPLFETIESDNDVSVVYVDNLIIAAERLGNPEVPVQEVVRIQAPVVISTPADPTDVLVAASNGIVEPTPHPTQTPHPGIFGPAGCEHPAGVSNGRFVGRTGIDDNGNPVFHLAQDIGGIIAHITTTAQFLRYDSDCGANIIIFNVGYPSEQQVQWDLVINMPDNIPEGSYLWSDFEDTWDDEPHIFTVDMPLNSEESKHPTIITQVWPPLPIAGQVDLRCDTTSSEYNASLSGWATTGFYGGTSQWFSCDTPGRYKIVNTNITGWILSDAPPPGIPEGVSYKVVCTGDTCSANVSQ